MKDFLLLLFLISALVVIVSYDAYADEIGHGFQNVTSSPSFTTTSSSNVLVTNAELKSGNFTAGEDYLILVTAQFLGSNVGDLYDFYVGTSVTDIFNGTLKIIEPASIVEFSTYSTFVLWQPTGGEGSLDIGLYVASEQSTTLTIDQVTMTSLKVSDLLATDFFYDNVETDFDLATIGIGVWSNADNATVTFTPLNDGDTWLVGTSADIGDPDVNDAHESGISVNGTDPITSGGMIISDEGEDNSEIDVFTVYKTFVLANTEQTFAENFRNDGDDIGLRLNSQVFALRLNTFVDFVVNFNATEDDILEGSYELETLTADLVMSSAGDAFIMAQLITDRLFVSLPPDIRLQVGNVDAPETQTSDRYEFDLKQDSDEELPFQIMNMSSLSGTNTIDNAVGSGSSFGDDVEDRMIVAFSMELAPDYIVDLLDLFESESTTLGSGISLCQNIDLETSASTCDSELEVGHTYRWEITVRNDGAGSGSPTSMDIDTAVQNFDLLGTIPASQMLDSGCSTNTDWTESIVSTDARISSGTTCSISASGGTEVFWVIVRILSDAGGSADPTVTFTIDDGNFSDVSTTTTFNVNNIIGGSYG